MSKIIFILLLYIISTPVYATGFDPQGIWAFLFIFVFLLPYIIGVICTGKGNRYWFSCFSFITYGISIGLAFLFPGLGTEDIFIFFFPYILIIVAFIMRKRNAI